METEKKIIQVELTGGLGNQLFGWATGFALAKKLGCELAVNKSQLINRAYQLDTLILDSSLKELESRRKPFSREQYSMPTFREKSFNFDSRFMRIERPCILKGYFQSWKYFESVKQEIRREVTLKAESKEFQYWENIFTTTSVLSIHVRRGDYVGLEDYHGITSKRYFDNAISLLREVVSFKYVAVFSDDIEQAKIVVPNADYYISNKDLESPTETLLIMSLGCAIIGSNSSFSWWAGFLSDQEEKARVFPRPWFAESSLNTNDLLPSHWITLGI